MWDFLFETIDSGEWFFIECEYFEKAMVILEMSGFKSNEVEYHGKYSIQEAEMMGFDTY